MSDTLRGDDPMFASYLRLEERKLETGGLNYATRVITKHEDALIRASSCFASTPV